MHTELLQPSRLRLGARLALGAIALVATSWGWAGPSSPDSAAEASQSRPVGGAADLAALPAADTASRMQGEHVARQGTHPSLLRASRPRDPALYRLRIGELPDSPTPPSKASRSTLQPSANQSAMAGSTNCSGADFVGRSGTALISFIDAAALRGCMYSLYAGSVSQYRSVFSDANIITVANELQRRAVSYPGNDSTGVGNLLQFLRGAGYWYFLTVDGDPSNNIPPGSAAMLNAARSALLQLVASPRFLDPTEANTIIATEVYKLAPSGFSAALAPSAKQWLDQATVATANVGYSTADIITQAMNVFFYGSFQASFKTAVANDPQYARALDAFMTRNSAMIGTANAYHLENAIGEMIRFAALPALTMQVRNLAVNQLPKYPYTNDNTIGVWMRAATVVDAVDKANCNAYGTCDGQSKIAQQKLPINFACGTHYKIRAQAMTTQQLQDTCTSISNQTSYFHTLMGSNPASPVANDNNSSLELVVFNSSNDYKRFSGFLFGNNSDNGGIYLEGDPAQPGNQARFIAYRAEWLGSFEIWNLNHEFTHYLDGRFNMAGSFGNYPLSVGGSGSVRNSAVWWIEGVAEYVSHSFRRAYYADATSRAQTAPLGLGELFKNTYNSGQTRVYNWGYLATRYMLERQPSQVNSLLSRMRSGDYAGYSQQMDTLGSSLDSGFSAWLTQCVSGGDVSSSNCLSQRAGTLPLLTPSVLGVCNFSGANTLGNGCSKSISGSASQSFSLSASTWSTVYFQLSGVNGPVDIYAKTTGTPTETDFQYKASSTGGKDVLLEVPTGGQSWIYVLVVPRSGFTSATLRGMYSKLPFGSAGGGGSDWTTGPACSSSNAAELNANGCVRSGLAGSSGSDGWMYVFVPAGKTSVTVRSAKGSGNADLYVKADGWPSTSSYGCRSISADNTDSCTLTGLAGNAWVYINRRGSSAYSGLSISAVVN
ncbi:collagenase [Roseateles sp.]|uniref:M9 family metallopeptidase n=1 Tax=Roseateles sp. TaxID=1971397 RepID=UPI003BA55314